MQHVEARHSLAAQQHDGVAVGLLEDRRQQIPGLDLLLLRAGRVVQRALEHAVHRDGLVGMDLVLAGLALQLLAQELVELGLEGRDVGAAVT